MPVYVDNARNPYRGMLMCHCWADTREELFEMMRKIGIQLRWFQRPPKASWEHFDICQAKRALAVKHGAIETDKLGPLEHTAKLFIAHADPKMQEIGRKRMAMVESCRDRRT